MKFTFIVIVSSFSLVSVWVGVWVLAGLKNLGVKGVTMFESWRWELLNDVATHY
jgi:hypothetical protein